MTEQAIAGTEEQLADELGRQRYRTFRQVLEVMPPATVSGRASASARRRGRDPG
jgi:hypothetical protein